MSRAHPLSLVSDCFPLREATNRLGRCRSSNLQVGDYSMKLFNEEILGANAQDAAT